MSNLTEKVNFRKKVIEDLTENGGYVKGYDPKKCRVMDSNHNPLYNVPKEIIVSLWEDGELKIVNLTYVLNT